MYFLNASANQGGGKGILVSSGFCPTLTSQVLAVCTEEFMKDDHTYAFEGNGYRPSHRGSGISEPDGNMFTLNTTEVHGVMYPVEPMKDESKYAQEPMCYAQNATDSRITPLYDDVSMTLNTRIGAGCPNAPLVREPGDDSGSYYVVRRITPKEAERLQGFPDDYTNIPWKDGKPCPDSHRYKALGNSMAVPVMRWIGMRIENAISNPIESDTSEPMYWQPELF